jgi:hypothetical protein
VRRLSDEDEARLRRALDQAVVVGGLAPDRMDGLWRPRGRRAAGTLEQHPHLLVGRLREVLVPQPDRAELARREQAHDVVGSLAQVLAHGGVGNRRGGHDARRLVGPHGVQRRQHRRTRGQSVVDEDDRAACEIGRGPVTAVGLLAALELAPLLGVDRLDPLGGQVQRLDHGRVEDADAARGDRSERVLLVAGHAELAHEEDVERSLQRARDLVRDGHPAARQGEYDDVVASCVVAQALRKQPPGVRAIPETLRACRGLCHLVSPLGRLRGASSPVSSACRSASRPSRRSSTAVRDCARSPRASSLR